MAAKLTDQIYVSLIIPAFNEKARIGKSLDRILNFLHSQPYSSEVIIVDDGSQDQTGDFLKERYGNNNGVRTYQQSQNQGKGKAVKEGMLLGNGEYLFFSDADLSVPIEALPDFLTQLEDNCDVTIGTRRKSGANIEVHQPFYREFLGKIYTRLTNWILGLRVTDFTCGFKGFRRHAALELFSRQRIKNWSFDAEILYLAQLNGFRVREVPVRWRNDEATKVRLWRDIFRSFLELLQIRFYDTQGKYR